MYTYPCLDVGVCWCPCPVVAFSPTVGAALNSAGVGVLGSILGAALGLLIIVLVTALAAGFSFQAHPVTMVCKFLDLFHQPCMHAPCILCSSKGMFLPVQHAAHQSFDFFRLKAHNEHGFHKCSQGNPFPTEG